MLTGQNAEQLREWATHQGYSYQDELDSRELQVDGFLQATDNWNKGANLIQGEIRGLEFVLFDMQQISTSRDSEGRTRTSYPERTVILFPKPRQIQETDVRFLNRGKMMQLLGVDMGNLRFAFADGSSGGFPEDQQAIQDFNRDYYAMSDEFEITENESKQTPDWISLDLLRKLQEGPGWSVEIGKSQVAIYRSNNVIPVDQRSESLEELHEIHALLDSRPSNTQRLTMTRSNRSVFASIIGPMMWIMGGAVVGMILTAAIYASLFILADNKLPKIMLLSFPIVGLAFMVGGAFTAVKLKRKFSG